MILPTPTIVAGIDVGKSALDAHLEPGGQARHFANTKAGRRALRNWLVQHGVTRAVFEPSGRYHRPLHQCLFDSGLETIAVNPLRSRRFAEAIGRLAKNDRVDASMLARYGLLSGLAATPPKAPILHRLHDWIAIRRKHVAQRAAQLKLHSPVDPDTAGELGDPLIQLFDELIRKADTALQACIASDPELARRAASIRSIPGLRPRQRRQPVRRHARARLAQPPAGGREHPRNRLSMAATSAIRCNPQMQACYERLTGKGKPHKVALVAVMHKLLALLGTLLRDDRLWSPEAPAAGSPC